VSLSLRALREAARLSQTQIAQKSGIPQPEISKIEADRSIEHRSIATLRRYVEALGSDLELTLVSKHGHRIGIGPPATHPIEATPDAAPVVVPRIDARTGEPRPTDDELGHVAYVAHASQLGGPGAVVRSSSSLTRRAVPVGDVLPWDKLTEGQQAHWVAVARAIVGAVGR